MVNLVAWSDGYSGGLFLVIVAAYLFVKQGKFFKQYYREYKKSGQISANYIALIRENQKLTRGTKIVLVLSILNVMATLGGSITGVYRAAELAKAEMRSESTQDDSHGDGMKYDSFEDIAQESNNSHPLTITFHGHVYRFYDYSTDWETAKQLCEEAGGHLVTITSEDENNFLMNHLPDNQTVFYWMGATDEEQEGVWQWVTGEMFNGIEEKYQAPAIKILSAYVEAVKMSNN